MVTHALERIFVLGLGLTVTESNIKEAQKQENKNSGEMQEWDAKKYVNKVGMI